MAKLEELEEIDISGNKLKAIPTTIMNCRRMHTVTAHSNCIEVFPEVMQLPEIKVRNGLCKLLSKLFIWWLEMVLLENGGYKWRATVGGSF